ncbi:hypothetical protein ACFE04_018880 [Oxalis oulophora]
MPNAKIDEGEKINNDVVNRNMIKFKGIHIRRKSVFMLKNRIINKSCEEPHDDNPSITYEEPQDDDEEPQHDYPSFIYEIRSYGLEYYDSDDDYICLRVEY